MKLLFLGDVMLGRLINEILMVKSPEYIWGNTLKLLRKVDFRMCNLECVISDKGHPWRQTPKVFHFRSDAKNIHALTAARINAVSLANNHAFDYQEEALLEMIEILARKHIFYAGAGKNIVAAQKPAIFPIRNKKIGLIAFTDNEPVWEAQSQKSGVFYAPIDSDDFRAQILFHLIKDTKQKVDFLIVSAHWGPNWGYAPLPEHISFAHLLVEYGADLIFGHSPHIFRGIEIYNNKPILYSAGNFIDDYAVDPIERNDESFIFVLEINGREKHLFLYPAIIQEFRAMLAAEEKAKNIAGKMLGLCREFKTTAKYNTAKERIEINF